MGKRKLWISSVLIVVVLATIAYFGYRESASDINLRVREQLHAIWELKAKQIASWYSDGMHEAASIADDADLRTHLQSSLAGSTQAHEKLLRTMRSIRREQRYSDIVVLDSSRHFIASAEGITPKISSFDRWKQLLPADTVTVSPLYQVRDTAGIAIDFIRVAHDDEGRILGYVILILDFSGEIQDLVEFWPTESRSGESFLLARENDHAVYLNNLRFTEQPALVHRLPIHRTDVIGVRAVRGDTGIIEGVGYHGERVLACIGNVPATPWALTSQVVADEVYAPLRTRVYITGGFVILILIVSVTGLHLAENRKQLAAFRERFAIERQLSDTKSLFQTTIYSIPDGVIITDAAGIVTQMNSAAQSLTGWSEPEACGIPLSRIFSIIDEEHRLPGESPVETILRKGVVVGLANHTILVRRDGTEIPIADSGAPIRNADGTLIGIVLVIRDQSEERAFIRALEENEEKYRSLVEFSTDAVFVNQGGRFVYCNPAALDLIGTDSQSDILGKTPFDFFHPDDHDIIRARIKTLLETGVPRDRQHFRIMRVDGAVIDVEASATLVRLRGNPAIQVVVRDISERLASRRKIEDALAIAEQANKVKTLFLTNISHELRTPLNNILGYNTLIRESCPHANEDEYAEYFEAVTQSGERLLRTVHSILEISRIQSGTYERLQQDFDLVEMLAPVIEQYRTAARQRGLAMIFVNQAPAVLVHGDVESLRVAISHLIDNAVKFTNHGGVDVRLSQSDGRIEVNISDTGIGISAEYISRLREPFSQESEGFTKKYQGIGLGMSIAIHHLEANNVAWEVRSEVGKGTRFVLRFS